MRLRRRQCIPSCSSHHRVDEDEAYWRRKKASEELAWSHNSAHVISQLTQCFTNAMVGPRSWIGGIFSRSGNRRYGNEKFIDYHLSPLQEQRLQRLQERLYVPFDETRADHQKALRELWCAAFPDVSLRGLISEQWKDMGWQGANPSTDFSPSRNKMEWFQIWTCQMQSKIYMLGAYDAGQESERGCGFISLENLLFFARSYPDSFHRLLFKKGGKRATWEYPFAVAGINVSFMLIQMLELDSEKPRCLPGMNFVKLLGEDEEAFDVLYCIAFEMMDAQWLAMRASYMEFNDWSFFNLGYPLNRLTDE
ncbi:ELMO domain-containing protein A isoform X2 [Camellia sinensis]|uniref:ELMO domain-containing protein A isoform X2 n=1 Tax=Camellia sinensis TaxID=4442 RepID=UPI001035D8E9|nr:ELMO domain-containing protein A isoform X2 [Camellia sinensis]